MTSEAVEAFEHKAITAIMEEGFSREEAQDIFNDWLARAYKRLMVNRWNTKLLAIR